MREGNRVTLFRGMWVNDRTYNIKAILCMSAVEIILAFSPFGFIILGKVSITTLFIGVMAGALWGGPVNGGIIGLVFGLTSMWKSSVTAVNPGDLIFSPFFSGSPMASVVLALVPRVMFGLIAGLFYFFMLRIVPEKGRIPVLIIISAFLERINSGLTYLFMELLFQYEGAHAINAFRSPFSLKRITTYAVVAVIMILVYILYDKYGSRKYYDEYKEISNVTGNVKVQEFVPLCCTVIVIMALVAHLWEREKIILSDIDKINLDMVSVWRFNNVFLQFMIAALAASFLAMVLLKHVRSVDENRRIKALLQLESEKANAREIENRAMRDPLTGAYNRNRWEIEVDSLDSGAVPYAIMTFDIDDFKSKNDEFGHDVGDLILIRVVSVFYSCFRAGDLIFRFGGDEFVVLVPNSTKENADILKTKADNMNLALKSGKDKGVPPCSVSIGIAFSDGEKKSEDIYKKADIALYAAKRSGKGRCCISDSDRRN